MLSEREKSVIGAIQGDIPVVPEPYHALAKTLDLDAAAFLETLQSLRDQNLIRRFGATLRHQKSGYAANAMGAWQVPEDRIEDVGRHMATCRQISHCYRRNPMPQWPFNLYTMIHAESESACWSLAHTLAAQTEITRYTLLFSRRELKKTSMQYFK